MLKHLFTIACFSVVIPLGIGIRFFRTYGNDLKALTFFLALSAIVEITSYYLWYEHRNNLPLLHLYTLIEFVFLSYIYREHIASVIPRRVINAIMVLFILFSVFNSLYIQSIYHFNTYARGIEIVLILFYAIVFVYALITRSDLTKLTRIPMFWVNTGVLLYYTTSFFVFLLSNNMLLMLPKSAVQLSWGFHGIFLLIYHAFLSVALWIHPKR